jgi:hypothetical protein
MRPPTHHSLLLFVATIALAGCQTDAESRARWASLHSVAMLPAQIRTGTLTASQRLVGPASPDETRIRLELPSLVAEELGRRGFIVKSADEEMRFPESTNHIWDAHFRTTLTNAYATVSSGSVRPEGKELADHLQADGLIFMNVFAFNSTTGRKALVGAFNALAILATLAGTDAQWTPWTETNIELAVVDGTDGKVLWTHAYQCKDFQNTDSWKIVSELMKSLPTIK